MNLLAVAVIVIAAGNTGLAALVALGIELGATLGSLTMRNRHLALALLLLCLLAGSKQVDAQLPMVYQAYLPFLQGGLGPDIPPICEWEPQDQCLPAAHTGGQL